MPQKRKPRAGSMQYWPRKRARRIYSRVRSWAKPKEAKLLGFAGYKVGMTHLMINDNHKASTTKGMRIFCPATIIECRPLKPVSIRFYKSTQYGSKLVSEVMADNFDKELKRKIILPKKKDAKKGILNDYDYIRLVVHTYRGRTVLGKKMPEIFEAAIGGSKEDQMKYAQEKLGKEINISEVFKEGQQLDIHAVSKGKGVQGPVKRFGVSLRQHKSEKGVRRVGSLGGWKAQGHIMWRVAKAGKMGYHTRTERNKWLLKIGNDAEMNKKGGFEKYGVVKNPYVLVKGSVTGPKKSLVRFNEALVPNKTRPSEAPSIQYIHLGVKQ